MKIFIVFCLLAVVGALIASFYFLLQDHSKSKRVVNTLTVRITLSVLLLFFIFLAAKYNVITPHPFGY